VKRIIYSLLKELKEVFTVPKNDKEFLAKFGLGM
jgi:hypothetical protein